MDWREAVKRSTVSVASREQVITGKDMVKTTFIERGGRGTVQVYSTIGRYVFDSRIARPDELRGFEDWEPV